MKHHWSVLALILAAALMPVTAASAQDTAKPATDTPAAAGTPAADATATPAPAATAADGLSLGTEDGGVGKTYTKAPFDDWQLNCVKTADGKDEPCQLYQLLKDKDGNSVAEINLVALPDGSKAAVGATIITPLETLLTEDLRLTVDGGKTKRYPFTFCGAVGCVSRVGFTADELAGLKKGNKATLTIVPMAAPDQTVDLNVSLKGFTAGFDAVSAENKAPPKP